MSVRRFKAGSISLKFHDLIKIPPKIPYIIYAHTKHIFTLSKITLSFHRFNKFFQQVVSNRLCKKVGKLEK